MSASPEKTSLRLGYVPLLDAAPLAVALEQGYFEQMNLEVELVPFASWAGVRDRLAAGQLDGAHLLAPMVLASRLGFDALRRPLVTAFAFNRNGNTLVTSSALHAALEAAAVEGLGDAAAAGAALRRVIAARRTQGQARLVLAHVHPHSMHHLLLRDWLQKADIDPAQGVRFCSLPPSQMADHLRAGDVDGFCAGAPWGALAEAQGSGRSLLTSAQIWPEHPEKVLAVTEDWAASHPQTHRALVAALLQAARWSETAQHRDELVRAVTTVMPMEAPAELLHHILERRPASGGPRFYGARANWPDPAHAAALALQLCRACGRELRTAELAEAVAGFLPQLHQQAEADIALEV